MHVFKKETENKREREKAGKKRIPWKPPFPVGTPEHTSSEHCRACMLARSNQINLQPQCHLCIQNSSSINLSYERMALAVITTFWKVSELPWKLVGKIQMPRFHHIRNAWGAGLRDTDAATSQVELEPLSHLGWGPDIGEILTWGSRDPGPGSGSIPGCACP